LLLENLSVYTAKHQHKDHRPKTKWKLNRRNRGVPTRAQDLML